ncbi:MAG: transposase [Gammaproteobacteria bacterium]|nr:transposase [Gammaproteobacteria bacterium]
MNILPYTIANTNDLLTGRGGLVCVAELMRQVGFSSWVEREFPRPGSNRGYPAAEVVTLWMLMLHEGARCLDDVRHLRRDQALRKLLGLRRLPSADMPGDWLRRLGKDEVGIKALVEVNRRLLKLTLGGCAEVTLDIDATPALCDKREAQRTCLGEKGYLPMLGHIGATGQVAGCEFRAGNVPPAQDNAGFIRTCVAGLPAGVSVKSLRADAASYHGAVFQYCDEHELEYVIRAKRSQAMDKYKTPFTLVVQRYRQGGQQCLDLGEGEDGVDDETTMTDGRYIYRALATNRDDLTDSAIVHWYNRRGEENRIKELKSDFAGERLPCGQFEANALYFHLCVTAYNLFVLLRHSLPPEWHTCRAPTFRWRVVALAAKVVCHARQVYLKFRPDQAALIKTLLAALAPPERPPPLPGVA